MPPQLFFAINTVILGYALTIASLILNYLDADKTGMALVIVSWIAAYFADLAYVWGTNHPLLTRTLQYVSIAACGLSLAVWYF